jgi:antitoxin component YwqK of YwqJK toxin-antitoxin module
MNCADYKLTLPTPLRGALLTSLFLVCSMLHAQLYTRQTWHDAGRKHLKEIYQVRDTVKNILHGRYISYFLNGAIESKGHFVNNETTGIWEFFYETGNLKMKGVLRQNSNYGLWEYFFENGQKSMEGTIHGKNKEGEWKIYYESGELRERGSYKNNKRTGLWTTFFEDGAKKGEIEYTDDYGRFTEYFHSGRVYAEGPRSGNRNVGHWRFFTEDGALAGEGEYANGKRHGLWKFYYPSGKMAHEGRYEHDQPAGPWTYYFENGAVSASGVFAGGRKNGNWSAFYPDGALASETIFERSSGEFRAFYPNRTLKAKGFIREGHRDGPWQFFRPDGTLEGTCQYIEGKGVFTGHYPNGALQTKGVMEDDQRVGTWELYEADGTLAGYYKPLAKNDALAGEIQALAAAPNKAATPSAAGTAVRKQARRGFTYFQPRTPEYQGVILALNPMMMFLGQMPLGIEFYNQGRLGHEFGFEGLRDPFFTSEAQMPQDRIFSRGYAIFVRQKFYNPMRTGMWYFAHELRFVNRSHFNKTDMMRLSPSRVIIAGASEQRAEYGIQLGVRLMQKNDGDGFTIDAFTGYSLGYRRFDVEPVFSEYFDSVNRHPLSHTFRVGLNFGYSFSFDGRR